MTSTERELEIQLASAQDEITALKQKNNSLTDELLKLKDFSSSAEQLITDLWNLI